MSLSLQEPLTFTKKELKKEFSDQGLARASNVHKKVKIDLIGDRLEGIA